MNRFAIALLLVVGCTTRGPDREGAVAVTAHLALLPGADDEPWVRDISDAIHTEQLQQDELTADGVPAPRTLPYIDVSPQPLYSDRAPPIDAVRIHAGDRNALATAFARAQERRGKRDDIVPLYEHGADGWQLYFAHSQQGFELAAGAMAKVVENIDEDGPTRVVTLFLADEDAPRFEQLTREHVGRRIALVSGDESLMFPVVREAIPGGRLQIAPGLESADAMLARLVR
ncbi:MAG TPA: hypothetical protein VG755_26855 [Nannocystaceae bacterium]|nr:hypothetical protein [Nannocystaceae bacterium]